MVTAVRLQALGAAGDAGGCLGAGQGAGREEAAHVRKRRDLATATMYYCCCYHYYYIIVRYIVMYNNNNIRKSIMYNKNSNDDVCKRRDLAAAPGEQRLRGARDVLVVVAWDKISD